MSGNILEENAIKIVKGQKSVRKSKQARKGVIKMSGYRIEARWHIGNPYVNCVLDGQKIQHWSPTLPDPNSRLQKGPKKINYSRFLDEYVRKEIKKG